MSSLTNNELDAPPWLRVESTLMATARLIREAFDVRLAALGLNLTQASLLGYIAEFGSTSQKRLGDRLGVGRAAIGSVVDRLESLGLVERHPDPADRRVWLVDVTSAGRATADRVAEIDEVLRAELRHGIGREERQALSWVLTRLQLNLTSAIASTGDAPPLAGAAGAPDDPGADPSPGATAPTTFAEAPPRPSDTPTPRRTP